MSEENTEEIIIDTSTGEAPVQTEEAPSNEGVDTAPSSPEPSTGGKPKRYSLDDLSDDEEEASKQLAEMSKEDQQKYFDLIEGVEPELPEDIEPEKVEPEKVEGPTPFGMDPDVYSAFSDEQRSQVETIASKMQEMDAIDINHFRAGLQKFENDPILSARLNQLNGGAVLMDDQQVQGAMSREAIEGLGLDFRMHPEKSLAKIQNHLQNTVHNAISNVVNTFESQNKQRESHAILDKELDVVRSSYDGMSSDLPYSDANHPMADFMGWLAKNSGGINIRSIGGKVAYEAYLNATGKSKGLVDNAVARGQQDILDKLKRADKKVATLPRSSNVSKPTPKTEQGIDVKRLHSDADYVDSLLEKFQDNPKMRATIERLILS